METIINKINDCGVLIKEKCESVCHQQYGTMLCPLLMSLLSNNSLGATKCLCGSYGIHGGDYEILVEPKTKQGHFKKAGLCPGRPTNSGPGYRPRNSPVPFWT